MKEKRNHSFRNLILLLQGQFVSNLGNQVYDIAMLLWIKDLTGSAAIMGLAMLLTNLPEAVLAPFGGALADRFGKLRTLIISDVVSGLCIGFVLLAHLLPTGTGTKLAALGLTNLLLGICAACFIPAVSAMIPSLVSQTRLEKANAANQFSNVGGRVIGQSLGSLVFSVFGAAFAFGINAVSFLLSALSETFIRIQSPPKATEKSGPSVKSILGDLRETFGAIWRNRYLRALILNIAAFHLCLSALPILLPFLAEYRLHLAAEWVGLLYGSYTIGIMAGFVVAGLIPSGRFKRYKIIAFAAAFVGIMFCLAGLTRTLWLSLPALLSIGLGIGVIIVNLLTELQLSSPEEERGRTMGLAHAFGGSSFPLGMALFGLLLDGLHRLGLDYAVTISIILTVCGLSAIGLGAAMLRQTEKTALMSTDHHHL